MRLIFSLAFSLLASASIAQPDTIVVADLTEVMVDLNEAGQLNPVSDLEEAEIAGFFLDGPMEGSIRICNSEETQFYVNGRLLHVFEGCEFFELSKLEKTMMSDTLFLSLFSSGGIKDLRCEHVIFETHQLVKDKVGSIRSKRDLFNEFLIIAFVVTLLGYGWIISTNQSRRNYLLRKSFSFKLSSYEFVNTTFLNQSNFQFLILLSLLIGLLFASSIFQYEEVIKSSSLADLILSWLSITGIAFVFLFGKYLFSSLVAFLFRFRKMNDYQLFDFENFMLVSLSFVSALFIVGYLLFEPLQAFIQSQINLIMVLILLSFLGWFGLKFVNNSTGKKLQIISYLCATELIPTILLYIEISK